MTTFKEFIDSYDIYIFDETGNCYYKNSNDIKAFKHYPDLLGGLSKNILIYMSVANLQKGG